MPDVKESQVLSLLIPELLTTEDLIDKIQTRFAKMENLSAMSKENLVSIFRKVILPLPQRDYRGNRRGKMLSTRRVRSGLEGRKKSAGESEPNDAKRISLSNDRLKPPPDISKSRRDSDSHRSSTNSNRIVINTKNECDSSNTKIRLKRHHEGHDRQQHSSDSDGKRQRTVIRWP